MNELKVLNDMQNYRDELARLHVELSNDINNRIKCFAEKHDVAVRSIGFDRARKKSSNPAQSWTDSWMIEINILFEESLPYMNERIMSNDIFDPWKTKK